MPSAGDAPLVGRLLAPVRRFIATESASGVVLLAAAAIALGWANSPWAHSYHAVWRLPLGLDAGPLQLRGTLHELVNDGLMAIFFLLVGLEIKREVLAGELTSLRGAALPMFAALGGMLVPALLYAAVTHRGPGAAGWGIPMAPTSPSPSACWRCSAGACRRDSRCSSRHSPSPTTSVRCS